MVDIRDRHDWNNHKKINQKELVKLYCGLKPKGKKIVYSYLTEDRQKILDSGIKKYKKKCDEHEERMNQGANHFQPITIEDEQRIEKEKVFDKLKPIALAPLRKPFYRKIKNYDELALTYSLYFDEYTPELHFADKPDSNESKNRPSFDKCRDKMVSMLNEKIIRDYSHIRHYEDGDDVDKLMKLLYALQEVEYSQQVTALNVLAKHRARYTRYYKSLGIENPRAATLAGDMIDVLKHKQENTAIHSKIFNDEMKAHQNELIKLKEHGMLLRFKEENTLSHNIT